MIRIVGRVAAAGLVFSWLALPAAADGLSRFKEAMKGAPDGALTYKSAKALGDNGFVLEGVVVTPPADATPAGKTEPIEIKRIAVEDFDFAAVDKNAPPNFIKMRVEGIVIGAKPAAGVDLKELAGIDKITADFQLDYRLDPEKKTMTLSKLELDLNGLARLELSMILDGVSAESVDKPESAMNDATLRTATLLFEDRSLFNKVLPAAAKMQSIEADALVKIGKVMLDGLRAGQGTATLAVLDALGSYLEDYKQPKGPLRVTLNPPGKTSAADALRHDQPGRGDRGIGAGGVLCRNPAGTGRARRCRPREHRRSRRRQGRLRAGRALFRDEGGCVVVRHGARSLQIGRDMHRPGRWRRRPTISPSRSTKPSPGRSTARASRSPNAPAATRCWSRTRMAAGMPPRSPATRRPAPNARSSTIATTRRRSVELKKVRRLD